MKMTLRFLSKSFLFAAIGAMGFAAQAWSQGGFNAKSIYGGAEPNNASGQIVVYNRPTTGFYAGPADASFNVSASIPAPGTLQAAGYGIIMTLPASGEVTFNVPALPTSGTPNNIPNSISNSFSTVTQNPNMSIILGDTAVPGQAAGNLSLGVVGLFPTANQNAAVANGEGLFSVPIRVAAGTTGTFTLGMALGGNDYSGFAQTDGTVLTNPLGFPNANQTIVVRQSVRGDLTGDGVVNFADIGGFVAALSDTPNYQAQFPWLQVGYISDFTEDGSTNFADIGGFVNALSGGGGSPAAVPEPSTVALVCMGIALFGAAAARRRRHVA